MKLRKSITAGILLGATSVSMAAPPPPPLDRPTPPPCCADGLCYPKCDSWGWYQTRWRRWPTYMETAVPGVQPPAPLGPDTPPYVAPPKEDEEERAPEPTRPPEDARGPAVTPLAPRESTSPEGGAPSEERPSTSPGGPSDQSPSSYPTDFGPSSPDGSDGLPILPLESGPSGTTPSSAPNAIQPLGEPTGDADPPPSLPFGRPMQREEVARGPRLAPPKAARGSAPTKRPVVTDPPPSLPGTFASLSR